jgi:hypothetical protein
MGMRDKMHVVPSLRLAGDWLGAAGFTAGLPVVVTIEKGCLIIERHKMEVVR